MNSLSYAFWSCRLIIGVGLAFVTLFSACDQAPPPPPPPPPREVIVEVPVEPPPPVPDYGLHEAARRGQLTDLKLHLADGADLNARAERRGYTPLHEAAAVGQVTVVAWLLEQGVEVAPEDGQGLMPLDLATAGNHEAVVQLLIAFGATPATEEDEFEELAEPEEPVTEDLPEGWEDKEFRAWTSAAGQQVEAAFIEMRRDIVTLGARDGGLSHVPLNQFSREDQVRIQELSGADRPTVRRAEPAGQVTGLNRVTAGFGGECERVLLAAVNHARQEILVAIYTITRAEIERAFIRAAQRGVRVHVKFDGKQIDTGRMGEVIDNLNAGGVVTEPITMRGRFASMHHKFAVIDRNKVFTGSFNFTVTAVNESYENCVLIESAPLAREFRREFDDIRNR